jgi:hypothetical protein
MTTTTNEATTDLQKPFTDGELRALLEQYPARPPTMGGSNVSHENSYLDHYVVSAWEKKCSAILKRREDAAPKLAARVLELEAENKRLQKALKPLADAAETLIALDYQGNESTTLIGDVALFGYHFKDARVALKGGEV